MLKIGIAGCGNWSNTVLKEIKNNKNFNLESVFCRNYNSNKIKFDNSIKIYENIESFFLENINDCIYVAGSPELNFKAVNLAIKNKIPLILEKPISNNSQNLEKIQFLTNKYKLIIIPNLTNYFSDSFNYLKNYVDKNFDQIKRIIIFEGGNGPYRKNIHPIWDWGFHSFSTLLTIFENRIFSKIIKEEIKSKAYTNDVITRFNFRVESKFDVKLISGNLLKQKIRKFKIILKNNNVLESNMINHKIYLNKKIVFESNMTPLQSLLNNFYKTIKESDTDYSKNLINISNKTTKILENFYNC
jgi:predicted dehydrogenase